MPITSTTPRVGIVGHHRARRQSTLASIEKFRPGRRGDGRGRQLDTRADLQAEGGFQRAGGRKSAADLEGFLALIDANRGCFAHSRRLRVRGA